MSKYQIVEIEGSHQHAGTKATADVRIIAEKLGYTPIYVKMDTTEDTKIAKIKRQVGYYRDWKQAFKSIEKNSIVLLQHPFHNKQLTRERILTKLKEEKNVKYISFIHDIEKLRKFRYNAYYAHEYDFMKSIADVIVCHNEAMKKYLIEDGFEESKIVVLGIFDYLQDKKKVESPHFKQSITIAGNLDVTKCGYISELSQLRDIDIQLYGPNFDKKLERYDNIHYHGSFPPDQIPNQLKAGFGLVWDGNSLDGCKGDSGQYLKYNNPHKLSLYLSSGLPVVLWKQAAEASFVETNNVGICIKSLYDLNDVLKNINESEYNKIIENVNKVADLMKIGSFASEALLKAEKRV